MTIRAARGVRERVVDQDSQELGDALAVADRAHRLGRHLEPRLRAVLGERRTELADDGAGQHPEVGQRDGQLDRPGLKAGEIEQLGRQLAKPIDLLAHLPDELAARLLVERLVLDQLEEAAERKKIGVRSSCEAVAMKRRRALSSPSSWLCM